MQPKMIYPCLSSIAATVVPIFIFINLQTMKKQVTRFILSLLIITQSSIVFPQNREPACDTLYPPSCFYQADTGNMPLIMCPPSDSLGNVPDNFIGYNVYREGELISYIPHPGMTYITEPLMPGYYLFSATAVYDLAPCGFPGETGESLPLNTICIIKYGYPLDFFEDWSSGGFDEQNWIIEGNNWSIYNQYGNPAPSAAFTGDPPQTDYDIALESYPLQADSLAAGNIYLDFDIKLDDFQSTGMELMFIEVWNWDSQNWITVDTFTNAYGSFEWMSEHLDITPYAISQVFKVRFRASGAESTNIQNWIIDNISIYRSCLAPEDLNASYAPSGFAMTWTLPGATFVDQWMQWDDDVNFTAIGTGGSVEFDVAARWEPYQLNEFQNGIITAVGFFPAEPDAYYKIRIWTGAGAANLEVDQPVPDPNIGEWNEVILENPVVIDITQELWIGYYLNTTTGYPAGCDDGPAIDGYGNMMNYGGWQTLIQINPELDYNWNIKALIEYGDTIYGADNFVIYRSDDEGPYFILGYSEDNYFLDDSACEGDVTLHEYKVSALYIEDSDTCESDFSNEIGLLCAFYTDELTDPGFMIFPVPSNNIIQIESIERIEEICLYNYSGNILFRKGIGEKTYILPVNEYPEGVYLLRVETGREVVSRKVIIMR
jgi:hypothetical protein